MKRGLGRYKVYRSASRRFKKNLKSSTSSHAYGDEWEIISAYVRKRDGYRCQIHRINPSRKCSGYYPPPFHGLLHAHHILERDRGGTDHPKNVISLCKDCHSILHGKRIGRAITVKQKQAVRRHRK